MASQEERETVEAILRGFVCPTILELGAHHGEDLAWLHASAVVGGGSCRYLAVEPDIGNLAILTSTARLPGVTVFPGAVAAYTGSAKFWPNEGNATSGSIRCPKLHLEYLPAYRFGEPTDVLCAKLDSLCADFDRVDFIWSDIQGAERDLIAGGQKTLARTRYLFTEFDDLEMYEGQADRETLLSLLPGWEIVKLFDENVLLRNAHCP
jgi:FkbM family methyltransferase